MNIPCVCQSVQPSRYSWEWSVVFTRVSLVPVSWFETHQHRCLPV